MVVLCLFPPWRFFQCNDKRSCPSGAAGLASALSAMGWARAPGSRAARGTGGRVQQPRCHLRVAARLSLPARVTVGRGGGGACLGPVSTKQLKPYSVSGPRRGLSVLRGSLYLSKCFSVEKPGNSNSTYWSNSHQDCGFFQY